MGTFCRTVTFPCHLPPVSFIERKNKQLINKSQKTNEKKERFRMQNLSKISNRKPVSLVLLSLCHVEKSTRDGNRPLCSAMLSLNN